MELQAQPHWRCVELLSDIHLSPKEAPTFQAWRGFMESCAADALIILGDLFEVWVGDDVLADPYGFEGECAAILREASQRLDLYVMCGNRDFLMGEALMQATGALALPDPSVLQLGTGRFVLCHGDAQCLGDHDYQQFRSQVRATPWQQDFLAKPLVERQAIARKLRNDSEDRKQSGVTYSDVDTEAAVSLLAQWDAKTLIHGHTHHPAVHALPDGKQRWVLSDWYAQANPPRGDVIRIERSDGPHWEISRRAILPGALPARSALPR